MTELEQIMSELYVADEIFEKQEQIHAEMLKANKKFDSEFSFNFKGEKLYANSEGEIVYKMARNCYEFKGLTDEEVAEKQINVYKNNVTNEPNKKDSLVFYVSIGLGIVAWALFLVFLKDKIPNILVRIILGLVVGAAVLCLSVLVLGKAFFSEVKVEYLGDPELAKAYLEAYREYNLHKDKSKVSASEVASKAYFYVVMTRYKRQYDEAVDRLNKYKGNIGNQKGQAKKQLALLQENLNQLAVYHGELTRKAEAIPPAYLQDRATVTKLLTLVLNKRADTVKELINLYETEAWREKVIDRLDRQYQLTFEASKATLIALSEINASICSLHSSVSNIKPTTKVTVKNETVVDIKVNN